MVDQLPQQAAATPAEPVPFLRANRVTLVAGLLALALAVGVYLGTPNAHGVASLWALLFSLSPFVAAAVAIGWLDLDWARRLRLPLILPTLSFLVFFVYFVPYSFLLFGRDDAEANFDEFYYTQLMMVPFVILALVLAVRLGGGSRPTVLRLAAAMLLVQLSGVEDLAFLVLRELTTAGSQPVPEVWDWADHIAARLGHHPTRTEAYWFIAVHLAVALTVLVLPGRWLRAGGRRLLRLLRPASDSTP